MILLDNIEDEHYNLLYSRLFVAHSFAERELVELYMKFSNQNPLYLTVLRPYQVHQKQLADDNEGIRIRPVNLAQMML